MRAAEDAVHMAEGVGGAGVHGHDVCHYSVCLHACVHVRMCVYVQVYVFRHIHVFVCMYTHTCIQRYAVQPMCVHCMYIMYALSTPVCVCKHVLCVCTCACKPMHCQGRRKGQPHLYCGTLARCDLARAGMRDRGLIIKERRAGDTTQSGSMLYVLEGAL